VANGNQEQKENLSVAPNPKAELRLPDGQISSDLQNSLSSPKIKNISLFQKCKSGV
jgi:hypothetical protein